MSTVYPLDHLTGTGRSLAYLDNANLWVFTDFTYVLSPWLALKRQSLDDGDLERLGKSIPPNALQAIHDRLMVQFNLLRRDDFFGMRHLRSQFRSYVERANIKIYKLERHDLPRILNPHDTLFGHGARALGADEVDLQRHALASNLAQVINARWQHKDVADRAYHNSDLLSRMSQRGEAAWTGAMEVLPDLGELMQSAKQAGRAVIEFAEDTAEVVVNLHLQPYRLAQKLAQTDLAQMQAGFVRLQADLQRAGMQAIESLEALKARIEAGKAVLTTLLNDALTRQLLWDYLDSLMESTALLDKVRLGARVVVEIGLELVIAIGAIALAAFTSGASLAVIVARVLGKAKRIGHFTVEAIQYLMALYKKLVAKIKDARGVPEKKAETTRSNRQNTGAEEKTVQEQKWKDERQRKDNKDDEELDSPDSNVLNSSRTRITTGVESFDRLFSETPQSQKMIAGLERRGVTVVDDASRLDPGASAHLLKENGKLVVIYDSKSTSFLDMLHESRHVAQVQRVEAAGVLGEKNIFASPRLLGAAERGAYEYEHRLGNKHGFSSDYMKFVNKQIDYYYPSSYSKKFTNSPTMNGIFNAMEPGLKP